MIVRIVVPLLLATLLTPALARSPLHPDVALLDVAGRNVLDSGRPVSLKKSCGVCHDTDYIVEHSYHAQVGADETFEPGTVPGARPWDTSAGMFGRWDPLAYRRIAPGDLDLAGWTKEFADRHVGGGPSPVEMNCLLCHQPTANNARRIETIRAGRGEWASTATLSGSGLVEPDGDGWRYVAERFTSERRAPRHVLKLGDPSDRRCSVCHVVVHQGASPLHLTADRLPRDTLTTGQVFAGQLVSNSALNLKGKEELRRPWDVHAERLMSCTDCHHSSNNPMNFSEADRSKPRHLTYDARRMSLGDYLLRPSHDFTKGESAQGNVARRLDGSMRRCEGCHDALPRHDRWLPNAARHLQVLLCEACHIPHVPAGALQQVDWTVLDEDLQGVIGRRGIDDDASDPTVYREGYEPAILPRHQRNGRIRHGPHNLVTFWYWTGGDPPEPVPLAKLREAWLPDGRNVHPDLVAALDRDGDGRLAVGERRLDTAAGVAAMAARLVAVGVTNPGIEGLIQPYSLHHAVVGGAFATRACSVCHSRDSRLTRPFPLSTYVPHGAVAKLVEDTNVRMPGRTCAQDGGLCYLPVPTASGRYVIGHDRAGWIDLIGLLIVLGTLSGVTLHAFARVVVARRRGRRP